MKQYDFTSLNDFFNEFMSPKELADQLVQILFNYASCVNEETLECFKNDADTINLLYQEITKIKSKI
jgi:hypothetical protein